MVYIGRLVKFPNLKPKEWKARPGTWIVSEPASYSPSGKRENHYFKNRNKALEWVARYKAERNEYGKQTVMPDERTALMFFRQHVGDLNLMPEVVRHWLTTSAVAIKPISVANLVAGYLGWRPHQGQWSRSTAEDTVGRFRVLTQSLGDRLVHELTTPDIESFLSVRGSPGTRAKFLNKLRPLFRYAKRNRHVVIDPMEEIEAPTIDYKEIALYAPDEMGRMLAVAEEVRPELVPFIALTGFGFLRAEEIIPRFAGDIVLDWSAFDWTDKQIFVPHAVAKKAKKGAGNDRPIPFNPALLHWLEPYVKPCGQIVKIAKLAAYRALKKIRTKADVRDVNNGLRHSCLTFWLAANGDESIGTVSRWSGNSPAICKRHYVATVKRAEGAAWFGIRRG
jgi:integrase